MSITRATQPTEGSSTLLGAMQLSLNPTSSWKDLRAPNCIVLARTVSRAALSVHSGGPRPHSSVTILALEMHQGLYERLDGSVQ